MQSEKYGKNWLNEHHDLVIEELCDNGILQSEFCRKYNVSKASLSKYLITNNIKPKFVGKIKFDFTEKSKAAIKYLLEESCVSPRYIGFLVNLNEDVIYRLIKENNWKYSTNKCILNSRGQAAFIEKHSNLTYYELQSLYEKECAEIINKIQEIIDGIDSHSHKTLQRQQDQALETPDAIEFMRKNYLTMTIPNMAKHLKSNKNAITRALYRHKLFALNGYKKRNFDLDNNTAFNEDIANKFYTTSMLAKKYNVSNSFIYKRRMEKFGCFQNHINPHITRSSLEYDVEILLQSLDIMYDFQHDIDKERVDFYLGHKLVIECNGVYWHESHINKHDTPKFEHLKQLGYKVLYITEREIDNESALELIKNFYFGSLYEVIRIENLVNANQSGVQ